MLIEEEKKCISHSKSVRYELKQTVNHPGGLTGEKKKGSCSTPRLSSSCSTRWHEYWSLVNLGRWCVLFQ